MLSDSPSVVKNVENHSDIIKVAGNMKENVRIPKDIITKNPFGKRKKKN